MLQKFNRGHSELAWEVLTGDETWIYQYDPEIKMQSVVWPFLDESPPPKLNRSRSTQKKMVACFFGILGHVTKIPLEDRWAGTCIIVSRRSSKFGTSAAQRRESVAFFFIKTVPVHTQQQQR